MRKNILAWLMCLALALTMLSLQVAHAEENDPTSIALSNEENRLISELIDTGHGDDNLYQVVKDLQPKSGGMISDAFLAKLKACPSDSDIFTTKLSECDEGTVINSIIINSDGTVLTTNMVHARHYEGRTGYSVYSFQPSDKCVHFIHATSPEHYIDFVYEGTVYKVFAVAWSPQTTIFALSNEAGGLIDKLIADGWGGNNLYEVVEKLKPTSGGIISDAFLAKLKACSPDSGIFTTKLSEFAQSEGAALINSDGTVLKTTVRGRGYLRETGYSPYLPGPSGTGRDIYTCAQTGEYFISVFDTEGKRWCKVFAVAWRMGEPTAIVISNEEGKLFDELSAGGWGTKNVCEVVEHLGPLSGGVISDAFVTKLKACPDGSDIFRRTLDYYKESYAMTVCANGNIITPTYTKGRDYYEDTGYATHSNGILFTYAEHGGYYIEAKDLDGRYDVFVIVWKPNSGGCEIVGDAYYATLQQAIDAAPEGGPSRIRLLETMNLSSTLSVNTGRAITLDLNGHDLNIEAESGAALDVGYGASLTTKGAGSLNAKGVLYGVYAHDSGSVNITGNAEAAGSTEDHENGVGVYADGSDSGGGRGGASITIKGSVIGDMVGAQACTDGIITVTGDVTGHNYAVSADKGGAVTITGNVTGTGIGISAEQSTVSITGNLAAMGKDSNGIFSSGGSEVTVTGNVAAGRQGISANASQITVNGSVTTKDPDGFAVLSKEGGYITVGRNVIGKTFGVLAEKSGKVAVMGYVEGYSGGVYADGGTVTVSGDVRVDGAVGVGVGAGGGGKVTIDGAIQAHKAMIFGETDGIQVIPSTKAGYLEYSDGKTPSSHIWIKEASAQPTIQEFPEKLNQLADKEWAITFSRPVSLDEQNLSKVYVATDANGDNQVEGIRVEAVPGNDCQIRVKPPATNWTAGATYYLILEPGLQSITGKSLNKKIRMKFTIQ